MNHTEDGFPPPPCPTQQEIDMFVIAAGNGDMADVNRFMDTYKTYIDRMDSCGDTALTWAIHRGESEIIKLLLSRRAGADVNDRHGKTPLIRAVEHGDIDAARLLLEKGANIDARDDSHWTPLMHAAYTGKADIVSLFLEKEADAGAVDRSGNDAAAQAEINHPETARMVRKWVKDRKQQAVDRLAADRAKETEAALKKQRPKRSPFGKNGP